LALINFSLKVVKLQQVGRSDSSQLYHKIADGSLPHRLGNLSNGRGARDSSYLIEFRGEFADFFFEFGFSK
jgi:hypothetical protein